MQLGLQLYTIREALLTDFTGSLERVSALGFQGVEFAGNYGGLSTADLSALLQKLKLEVAGLHVGLDLLELDLETHLKQAQGLGAKYLICPWLPEERYAHGFAGALESLHRIQSKLSGSGVQLAYHNHVFEFELRVENQSALDAIAEAGIELEFDMAWGFAGGVNPEHYLQRHAGQVPLLHVKDLHPKPEGAVGMDAWDTVELGAGQVPLLEGLGAAASIGVQWALVEQDHCSGDVFVSLERSLDWWRRHQAVG